MEFTHLESSNIHRVIIILFYLIFILIFFLLKYVLQTFTETRLTAYEFEPYFGKLKIQLFQIRIYNIN